MDIAAVESAIRLGARDWIYARGKLHFWESGCEDSPCHVDPVFHGFTEANTWLSSVVILEGGVMSDKTVAEVMDIGKTICAVCAMAWHGEF